MSKTRNLVQSDVDASAKMLVVAMGILWGCNWVAARIMLNSLGPWTVRTAGIGLGMITLFAVAWLGRISLTIPRGQRWRVFVASIFNVSLFSVCAAYSQVTGTTSRAIVIAYSMPIWTALLVLAPRRKLISFPV